MLRQNLFRVVLAGLVASGSTVLAAPIPQNVTGPAIALGDAYAAVIDYTKGSIVSVLSEKVVKFRNDQSPFPFNDPFFRQFFGAQPMPPHSRGVPVSGLGSGFILDDQGHILTNDHVVKGMEKIRVVLPNKQSYTATVLGSDAMTDLAVLKIKGKLPNDVAIAQLGDSDQLKTGNIVLAFGAPFGLTQTVTSGIISAKGRSNVGIAGFEDFLQTDAPINPGNSGGPLVNMHGEVIGINTAIATSVGQSAGVGFAIPINMAKQILPTLLQGKKVVRGMLGIAVQDVTPALAQQFGLSKPEGALVSQVNPGSPADKAGIKAGDVITEFAGKPIQDSTQLREMVSEHKPGSRENITVVRNGKQRNLVATLGELSPPGTEVATSEETGKPLEKFGIAGKTVTPELKSELGLKQNKGIVITNVDPGSAAGMAGIHPGDVITEVDRKKVASLDQADEVLAKSKNPDEALFLVNHKGESIYVTLETG